MVSSMERVLIYLKMVRRRMENGTMGRKSNGLNEDFQDLI